jgi:hypothetical protein
MNSNHLTGQTITSQPAVVLAVADVIGRTDKRALRSVAGVVEFHDVFNYLSTLRHASRYITNESGDVSFLVTARNSSKLASYLDLVAQDKVDGMTPTPSERESLQILSSKMRSTNDH